MEDVLLKGYPLQHVEELLWFAHVIELSTFVAYNEI
jgi:hypothetical protein